MLLNLIWLMPIMAKGVSIDDKLCSSYKRYDKNSSQSLIQCGPCLQGFEEIESGIISATGLKPCFPKKKRALHCDNDWDCPDIDDRFVHLCLDQQCEFCFSCEEYFRVENSKCAKLPFECGPCEPGFKESSNITEIGIPECIANSVLDLRRFFRLSAKNRKEEPPAGFFKKTFSAFIGILKSLAAFVIIVGLFISPCIILLLGAYICNKCKECTTKQVLPSLQGVTKNMRSPLKEITLPRDVAACISQ